MPESRNRNTRKALRTAFRICRISVLLLIAGAAAFFLWCNIFGLPRFITAEIQKEFQRRGIELEIRKVWLRGLSHFVARDVRLRGLTGTNELIFATRNAEFLIDFKELKNGNFSVSGHAAAMSAAWNATQQLPWTFQPASMSKQAGPALLPSSARVLRVGLAG